MSFRSIPAAVLGYGLLGLIPFIAAPVLAQSVPAHAGLLAGIVLAYGTLILSFLGGARWGLAVARPDPGFWIISLTMLPTLAALALLMSPGLSVSARLIVLAGLLMLQLATDTRGSGLPIWYPRFRLLLTLGAVTGLVVMGHMLNYRAEAVGTLV